MLTTGLNQVRSYWNRLAAASGLKGHNVVNLSHFVSFFKALPHVTISSTTSLTMPSSTMEFNEIVDDEPATRNDIVNDAIVDDGI